MASISGLGGNTLNSTSSIRGYGGLASGLDRDSLIESMTYATRSKIAAQKQKKEKISWTQEAMRNITNKTYEFTNKYTSYASSSNLLGSKLFSRNQITTQGANSSYVSVTGSSVSADTISILGVKQMAQNAQMTSNDSVSEQTLNTAAISSNLNEPTWAEVVTGESIFVKYGTKTYAVTLNKDESFDYKIYTDAEDPDGSKTKAAALEATVKLINDSLKKVSIGSEGTLGNVMAATVENGQVKFADKGTKGNTLQLAGSTGDLLKDLGFVGQEKAIIGQGGLTASAPATVIEKQSIAEQLKGKQISFSYNGTVKWITLRDDYTDASTLEDVQKDLQEKLNEAFGKNRILVDLTTLESDPTDPTKPTKQQLTFQTQVPSGAPDSSSVLAITAADRGILGNNSIFKIQDGESNRLNLRSSIANSGLSRGYDTNGNKIPVSIPTTEGMTISNGAGTPKKLVNANGDELGWDSSINDIINAINADKDLGIKVTYQSNADKFVVQSTEQGASGKIKLGGTLAKILFGDENTNYTVQKGQDAIITVKYAGSGEEMDITRGSNTISVDGLNVTVKGEFGYTKTESTTNPGEYTYTKIAGTEAITFDAQVDADNTTKIVGEMIEAYNEVLKLINAEVSQKPNKDYSPLTDEQREGLSDSQIEKWETEAKKGLLFNDTDVRGFADGLRFIIPSSMRSKFEEMGITVSTNYSDNGKLVFDETKFKAALQKDPDAVMNAFTAEEKRKEDGTLEQEAGLMTKMKSVMDKYASMTGATKGILVERAGSVFAPTSILQNSMQKQMDEIDVNLKSLAKKLKTEQDRYISQFSRLETLISQMNSQSSSLTSMFSS